MESALFAFLLALATASADEITQEMTWEVSLGGEPVGEQSVTVTYLPAEHGLRRMISSKTHLKGTILGQKIDIEERLTAHAGEEPASFHAVLEVNDRPREVQGRRLHTGWMVSIAESGRYRYLDYELPEVDLSTADLFDPETRVPISRFHQVRLLSAETGEVLVGTVERLGASTIKIAGQSVGVDGYQLKAEGGETEFWYTTDGHLVRYRMKLIGHEVEAVLRDPPPLGVDDHPLHLGGGNVQVIDL